MKLSTKQKLLRRLYRVRWLRWVLLKFSSHLRLYREKILSYGRKWRISNSKLLKEYHFIWRRVHSDEVKKSRNNFENKNKKKLKKLRRKWRLANPESDRRYIENHREEINARAREKSRLERMRGKI